MTQQSKLESGHSRESRNPEFLDAEAPETVGLDARLRGHDTAILMRCYAMIFWATLPATSVSRK
jgi:hypothetical protein